jgi:nucleoid DNA-binding protein
MNSIDLINNVAVKHAITTGRAEMILSIIVERLIEKLKTDGEVTLTSFGKFSIQRKKADVSSYMKLNEPIQLEKNHVTFEPDRVFLDTINSL